MDNCKCLAEKNNNTWSSKITSSAIQTCWRPPLLDEIHQVSRHPILLGFLRPLWQLLLIFFACSKPLVLNVWFLDQQHQGRSWWKCKLWAPPRQKKSNIGGQAQQSVVYQVLQMILMNWCLRPMFYRSPSVRAIPFSFFIHSLHPSSPWALSNSQINAH